MKQFVRFASVAVLALAAASASAAFVINEVDPNDSGTDNVEFVELKGNPGESAAGYVLVAFNGGTGAAIPVVKSAIDLSTCTANANGYILIGHKGVSGIDYMTWGDGTDGMPSWLENSEEAVALYQGRPKSDFPSGSNPSSNGLVDFLVYESTTNVDEPRDWSGFGAPVTVVNEYDGGLQDSINMGRVPDGTGSFNLITRTPKAKNATFTIAQELQYRRQNQFTVKTTTSTVTLRNTCARPLAVSTLALDPISSAAFTVLQEATPATSVTLAWNATTTMVVQYEVTDLTSPQTFYGQINFQTTDLYTPSGLVPMYGEFVPATTIANVGDVKINEVMYVPTQDWNGDGQNLNQYDEFVELYNPTDSAILIQGWQHRSIDSDAATTNTLDSGTPFIFPAGASIPAKGFVVVFNGGTPTGFAPGVAFAFYNSARFRNIGAYQAVRDGENKIIDAIAYLAAQDNPDADGYANIPLTVNDGGSYGRFPDGTNSWIAYTPNGARPSPGASNNLTAAANWMLFE